MCTPCSISSAVKPVGVTKSRTKVTTPRLKKATWTNLAKHFRDFEPDSPRKPKFEASTSSEPHVFQPLDTSTPNIRLIRILPGDNEIACTFHTFQLLVDSPPYRALSYTWGPKAPVAMIFIDERPFTVRKNLHLALQIIRSKMKDQNWGFWWIDALCINQDNVRERNHQVNLMSRIYSRADFVVSWLGPEAEDSSIALTFPPSVQMFDNPESLRRSYRSSVTAICQCAYWKRLWIVQETMLARDIVLLCGKTVCTWSEFENILRLVGLWTGVKITKRLPACVAFYRRFAYGDVSSDFRTLRNISNFLGPVGELECLDPRDRVFGLLGLLVKSEAATLGVLEADYSVSRETLLLGMLRYMEISIEWAQNQRGVPADPRDVPMMALRLLAMLMRMLELHRKAKFCNKVVAQFMEAFHCSREDIKWLGKQSSSVRELFKVAGNGRWA